MTENMEEIWDRWRDHYSTLGIDPARICRDGIVDPERFTAASARILFVLREVNDWKGGDLRDLLRDGPKYQVWHAVARWAAAILHSFPPFETIDRHEIMRDALQQIAAINLKKTSGGSSADRTAINAYSWQDRALLREQVRLIAPTIVVACGTWDELLWLFDLPVVADEPGRVVVSNSPAARFVPWVHPGRTTNRRTYRDLRSLMA